MTRIRWTALGALLVLVAATNPCAAKKFDRGESFQGPSGGQKKAEPAAKATLTKFDHAEYFKATSGGQKKAEPAVKGTLSFDAEKKTVDFLDEKGAPAFSIKYDAIKSMLYEKTSKPRYAAAVLVSPLFLLSHGKKHYLTIQYADDAGTGQYVIIHLNKGNAQEAIAAAEAQTGKKVERAAEK